MNKEKPRMVTIGMPNNLYKVIKGQADRKNRSVAGQINYICDQYFYKEK